MPEFKTVCGINLKAVDCGENDKIITVFTKEQGILQVIVKNAKYKHNRANLEPLAYNQLYIKEGNNLKTLIQLQNLKIFFNLRKNFDKLMHAFYWTELIYSFFYENEPMPSALNLFLDTLTQFENSSQNPYLYTLWFELQLLKKIGYNNNFNNCSICNNLITKNCQKIYFNLQTGEIICLFCKDNTKYTTPLSKTKFLILRNLKKLNLENLENLELKDSTTQSIIELHDLIKKYLSCLGEVKFKTIEFI